MIVIEHKEIYLTIKSIEYIYSHVFSRCLYVSTGRDSRDNRDLLMLLAASFLRDSRDILVREVSRRFPRFIA